MASIFSRRKSLPFISKDYRRYRPFVREDFHECCAFCLLHELIAGGERGFEIDHFKPKSLFSDLAWEYTNLYYTCRSCNNIKRNAWPANELIVKGYRFFDSCSDCFSAHFVDDNGIWKPLTNVGNYTVERLRLNSRNKVQVRKLLQGLISDETSLGINWDLPLKEQIQKFL